MNNCHRITLPGQEPIVRWSETCIFRSYVLPSVYDQYKRVRSKTGFLKIFIDSLKHFQHRYSGKLFSKHSPLTRVFWFTLNLQWHDFALCTMFPRLHCNRFQNKERSIKIILNTNYILTFPLSNRECEWRPTTCRKSLLKCFWGYPATDWHPIQG